VRAQIVIEHATLAETDLLTANHEDAARWLWSRGIRQWEPGTVPRDALIGCIERGEAYLSRLDGEPVGMAILQDADEYIWGERPGDALYLHGLRVLRAFAGQGLGRAILRWAEGQVTSRRRRCPKKPGRPCLQARGEWPFRLADLLTIRQNRHL
jgi:GNAT superfamily N-acetyltransferase